MPETKKPDAAALALLLDAALQGELEPLQAYLLANGKLAREMMNLPLIKLFADLAAERAAQPDTQPTLLPLLDQWAALDAQQVSVDSEHLIYPCVAVRSYGHIAAAHPPLWKPLVGKLHHAAADSRWRIREMVAMGLQAMLAADWDRALKLLRSWLTDTDPLVIRATVAGIAEPSLLIDTQRRQDALAIQIGAVEWFVRVPAAQRRDENVRVLRQGLGYTISVATAVEPEGGFALMEQLAAQSDPDLRWIVRENLKKNRLKKWPERMARLQEMAGRAV